MPEQSTACMAWLVEPAATAWGIYTPGLIVEVLAHHGAEVTVCFDNGHHPAGACHRATIPASSIELEPDRK